MRLPRPQFTVRRLMIAVAVVGILTAWGIEGERRRARFADQCFLHFLNGEFKRECLDEVGLPDELGFGPVIPGFEKEHADMVDGHRKASKWLVAQVVYYKHMHAKYEFASRYPWLPVLPDPPRPE
jgi:hypothetical protein